MKGFLSSKDIIFCLRKHWLILKVIKCTRSSSPLLSSWPYPYNLEVKGDETRRNRRSTCCKLLVMLKNKIYDLLLFLLPFILNMIWKTSPLNCLLRCKIVQHEVIGGCIIYFSALQFFHANELRYSKYFTLSTQLKHQMNGGKFFGDRGFILNFFYSFCFENIIFYTISGFILE